MFKSPEKLRSGISSVLLRNYLAPEKRRQTNMVVTGFPKSGTTWISQLCADYFGLHYERNRVRFRRRNVLLHTHTVDFEGRENLLYVVRDPREVICSAARTVTGASRSETFGDDGKIRPDFAAWVIRSFPGATTDLASHLRECVDRDWRFIRFEDLKSDAVATMTRYIAEQGGNADHMSLEAAVQKYDFSRLKSELPADKFLAQSSLSSWKDLLDEETLEILRGKLGKLPGHFGYDLG